MSSNDPQAGKLIVDGVERQCLADDVDRLVVPRKHHLRIRKQRGRVRTRVIEGLADPGLQLKLQYLIQGSAADIDVDLDAIPGRVVTLERLFRPSEIALLNGCERIQEERPGGLDGRDFEPLR